MPGISLDAFQTALEAAISRREVTYHNFYSFHFRWEDDVTNAKRDATSFKDLARYLGFLEPQEYVIPANERFPAWSLSSLLNSVIDEALHKEGRSILMVHYAGHGGENGNGDLELHNEGRKKAINAGHIISSYANDSLIPLDQPIDMVFIFDCCFSFLSTRTGNRDSRVVEILAANDARNPIAFGAGSANSFTSKLLVEIRARVLKGHTSVEMADVIDTLQASSPRKKPTYLAKFGLGSSTIPLIRLSPPSATICDSSDEIPGMRATFSIHVSKDFSDDELKDLVKWLDAAPKSGKSSLKLESVKATESMLFIFEGSRSMFFRIAGLPGVSLICENKPNDYSWLLHSSSMSVTPIVPLPPHHHKAQTKSRHRHIDENAALDRKARSASRRRYFDENAAPDRRARSGSLRRYVDENTWQGE